LDSVVPMRPTLSAVASIVSANSARVSVAVTDADALEVSINGQVTQAEVASELVVPLSVRSNLISVRAVDRNGNRSGWAVPVAVIWDAVPLAITAIHSPTMTISDMAIVTVNFSKTILPITPIDGVVMTISGNQLIASIPIPLSQGSTRLHIPQVQDAAGYTVSVISDLAFDR
jgi:hypothetical protein